MKSAWVRARRRAPGVGLLASTLIAMIALGACSDTTDPGSQPADGDDGGVSVLPPEDAAAPPDAAEAPDASADADASPEVDAGPRLCSDDGFCHSELPPGQRLAGVWGDGTGVVWTISRSGDVLRWDGAAWSVHAKVEAGSGSSYSIWGSGPTDLWILTPAGVFHGQGATSAEIAFTKADLPGDPTIPITSLGGTGPDDVWAVGGVLDDWVWPWMTNGRIVRYGGDPSSGGSGWEVEDELSSRGISFQLAFGSPGTGMWLAGQQFDEDHDGLLRGLLLRRAPGAAEWESIALPRDEAGEYSTEMRELSTAGFSSDSALWLRGITGSHVDGYWRGASADGGQTFTWSFTRKREWDRAVVALWGPSASETWGVGASGLVGRWNGSTFQQAAIRVTDMPVAKSFSAIWGTSKDDFWVVGDDVALHKTQRGKPRGRR